MNKLSEEQIQSVASWVREGATLADVQTRLREEHGLSLTYMDVRFLVDDLDLEISTPPPIEAAKPTPDPEHLFDAVEGDGTVKVSIDKIVRPGALVSGTVTFSDGQKAVWYLDRAGRLALNPEKKGYQPSREDVADFQAELQAAIEKKGGFY